MAKMNDNGHMDDGGMVRLDIFESWRGKPCLFSSHTRIQSHCALAKTCV
jgi:hypothetical protein